LVEVEEGSEATILPKVAAAEIAGDGRNHRAMVRVIRASGESSGESLGEREGLC
jgi:hypothetical protein